MAEKQLVVAVEGTAAMGPFWQTIVFDYLDKIIRSFCNNEMTGQKPSVQNTELSLVMFNAHGSYSACLVQRSGWTREVDTFLQWLSAIPFVGGGFNDAAIAEGLAEALMMLSHDPSGNQTQQNLDGHRHCILVAANNPHPLPTPVYRPRVQNLEQNENVAQQMESNLSDAEAVAQSFSKCSVSLSVICPKQLPRLRAIYNVGKRNVQAADPPIDNAKNPQFLVLISDSFMEACAALAPPGVASLACNQSPMKLDTAPAPPFSGPTPASVPSVNGSVMTRQSISVGNIPTTTVKVEPSAVSCVVSGAAFPQVSSVPRAASQGVPSLQASSPSSASQDIVSNSENTQELKSTVNSLPQSMRAVNTSAANVSILNKFSQARQVLTGGTSIGLQSMGGTHMAMHMSNMISSGTACSLPSNQNLFSSGQSSTISSTSGLGLLAGTAQLPQNSALGSFTSTTSNMPANSIISISQPMSNPQVGASMGQSAPGMSQGSLSGTQMVQSGINMNQNMGSALGPSNMSIGTGTMMPTPGLAQVVQTGMQPVGANNNSTMNMPLSQQTSSVLQSAQSKYVRVWEGNLSGQRQGQPVFITRLEGYKSAAASESLAENWPATMQIVRLISQDHMNNKQYVGKADFLVFRAMNQHGFLSQLQEKKLCAVIQLPAQTLLLSVSDKACRLIGMLFPGGKTGQSL